MKPQYKKLLSLNFNKSIISFNNSEKNLKSKLYYQLQYNYSKKIKNQQNPFVIKETPLTIQQQLFKFSYQLGIEKVQEYQRKQQITDNQKFVKQFFQVYNRAKQSDFMSFVKQQKDKMGLNLISPSQLLMITSTLQNDENIRQILSFIYPSINKLTNKQLQSFMQKILAFKPRIKPHIPNPRRLEDIQSILVVLSQIYPNDYLIQWLKQVPLYNGQNLYILALGAFSICQKLSKQAKKRNDQLLKKIQQKIYIMFLQQNSLDLKMGISILSLQMDIYPLSMKLLKEIQNQFIRAVKQLDPYKLFYLFISLVKHRHNLQKALDAEALQEYKYVYTDNQKKQKMEEELVFIQELEKVLLYHINFLKWEGILKLNTLIDFWKLIKQQNISKEKQKKESQWMKFYKKVQNITSSRNCIKMLQNCSDSELVQFIHIMDHHKIDNQKLLKNILLLLADRVQEMEKKQLIKLAKSLVTYVRQCQGYLVDIYNIIVIKRSSFTQSQIEEINQSFQRVQVLFPRKIE